MSNGKHSSYESQGMDIPPYRNNERSKSIVKIVILVIAILITCTLLIVTFFKTIRSKDIPTNANNVDNVEQQENTMPNKLGDYKVLGKLVISKINVEKYILEKTNENSLKLGVTKLYGPSINQTGNFCIAGHNYEDTFINLNSLEKEDTFYIEDTKGKKVTYSVYDKFSVEPDDLNCLMQNEKGKEVTLVTCETGATKRLVIKAKEATVTNNVKSANTTNTNTATNTNTVGNTTTTNTTTNNETKE